VDLYIHSPIRLHTVVLNLLSTGTALSLFYQHFSIIEVLWRQKEKLEIGNDNKEHLTID
jgi:hypothetical protein